MSPPVLLAPADAPVAGEVTGVQTGPDVTELRRRYPPRSSSVTWPATEQPREVLLARLLTTPMTMPDEVSARQRRRPSLTRLLDWLAEQPGSNWQQRWMASGTDAAGNAEWWRPLMAWARPTDPRCGVSMSSNLRVCALLLVGADVVRPSLGWVLAPRAPQNLVAIMSRVRDPEGFAELAGLCSASPAGRTMKAAALRRAATILAVKGGTIREITVGDCLELSAAIDGRSLRANKGMGFYQLLHSMGVFGPHAPSTFRAFATTGRHSPAQLIDRYGLRCRPVRDVLVDYLAERAPMLDHTTLRDLAASLGGLFWRDLERHHPGICSLRLTPEVAAAWKQRVLTKTRQVTRPDGRTQQIVERRAGALHQLAAVRAFYLDIAQWAMEEPARWGPWAAPCPIRAEDLARQKEIRSRKSRMDQRTRERLPVLPALLARANDVRIATAAALAAGQATPPGGTFTSGDRTLRRTIASGKITARIWAEDPDTGRRHDLSGAEDRAFWAWAAIETLRHTGIRIEELTELSHHSLIHHTLPTTGEPVPLLQIAPSKTDAERLLVISPELADVLAAVVHRVRGPDGALGCVASYDPHERVWNPPMPLLFQRRFGLEHRAIPAATIREWISTALDDTVIDAAGQPLRFTPHDFRRLFITDAVLHGMPPHIAQLVAGHRDINTTMGYKAVYPDEVINGHRAFIARRRELRPSAEYRAPTEQEWEEFLGHFERRRLAIGTCGRSYGTPCIHEHACLRCPLLRPDPGQRARLIEIRDNLIARIAEARQQAWLGELDGLQISLNGARQKLDQLDQISSHTRATDLGMPAFPQIAGRATSPKSKIDN